MKGKRLRSVVAVMLAFVLVIVGINPVAVQAEDLTSITWDDFSGAEYGKTYDTTDVFLTYTGSSLNNTAFEGDIIFQADSYLLYGASNSWHGLRLGVNASGQLRVNGSSYFNGTDAFDYTYDASTFGLTTLANTRFTLKVEMRNVTASYADVNVYVNGIQAGSTIALTKVTGAADLGKTIAVCPCGGSNPLTIPEPALPVITWDDFTNAVYGKTYNTVDSFLTYSGSSLTETAFEDYIQFSAGSSLMYGSTSAWHGIWLGVDADGTFYVKGSGYQENGNNINYTCPASTFELDTLADVKLKLRVEMRDVSTESARISVWINDVQVCGNVTVQRFSSDYAVLGNSIVLCAVGVNNPITIPEKPLTPITWKDFNGAEYGKTYSDEVTGTLTYSGSSLTETAFEDYISFSSGASLMYGSSNSWHGIWMGVDASGNFYVKGSGYQENGANIEYTCPASTFDLDTLADVRLKLRVETRDVSADGTSETLSVWINDVQVCNNVKAQRFSSDYATLSNKIMLCAVGTTNSITIPENPLTEITWEDFSNATVGKTYNTESWLTYTGESLNNTAFEDVISFSAGSSMTYATTGAWHGLRIGVNTSDQLFVRGDCYTDGGTGFNYTYDASTFSLSTLTDTTLTLRIEMRDVTESTANVKVYVNGIQAGNVIALTRDASNSAHAYLGKVAAFCVGDTNPITIPTQEEVLTEINWSHFTGAEYGKNYTGESWLTYSGDSLNSTAFEDDIIFTAGASMTYGTSGAWHGLRIGVNTSDQLFVRGDCYKDGENGFNYIYNASDFNLTTLTETRLKLRIEMRDVTESTANVKVYVNGIQAGNEIALTRDASNSAHAYLGKVAAFCVGDSNPVIIPKPVLTEITWDNFTGAEYGKNFTSEKWLTYSGESLNNTAFEGDIIFSAGASLTYATSGAWHGLRIGVNTSDQLFVRGDCYKDGDSGFNYTYAASTFGLATLTDTRLTLRIEMRDVTDSTANVTVYVNDIQAGNEIALTRDASNSAHAYLGKVVAFCVGDTNAVTILKDVAIPTGLTELSWEEFGFTGGQTYSSYEGRSALHLENLNNTMFSGNVIMTEGSQFRYGGSTAGWYGVQLTANADGTLSVSTVGSTTGPAVSTFNPKHYGLTSFAVDQFNLKIAFTEGNFTNTDSITEVVRVWVNDQILGDAFTFTAYQANILGTTLHMCTESYAITPYSSRTTVPTDLTEIAFKDWKEDVALDDKLDNLEISGANPNVDTFLGTTLSEIVQFVGEDTTTRTHTFTYGGHKVNGSDYGIYIKVNKANIVIECSDAGVSFTLDPQKAGIGSSFIYTELSWRIDTVQLGKNVLLYMSFNGVLYNNAPFVIYNFADTISNTIGYNSIQSNDATVAATYYTVLGASTKTLPVLYHDLSKGDYTIPGYQEVTFYEKDTNGEWVEATTPTTLTETGNYKLAFNDGVSNYTQEIACYYYQKDVSAASLVRSLKMTQTGQTTYEAYGEGYETRLCDTNYDGKVEANDVSDIKDMLLEIYQADADVMKISGFFSPTASLIEDATYEKIKATGVNHIIESDMYYSDDALDRYRVYAELSYAQKYGLTVTVRDQRLFTMGANGEEATVETVENAVANYKGYQSFAGLFIVDEPKASNYPNVGIWKGHDEVGTYSSVAKAIAAAGYKGWSNACGGDENLLYNGYNSEAGCYMLYGYYNYLQDMVDNYDLDFLSFTSYPFIVGGNGLKDNDEIPLFFKNLALAKKVAENNNIPLRTFVQSTASNENNVNSQFSEAHMKWMANIGLAFGSKSLEYFTLVQADTLKTYTDGSCANGMVDKDGNTTKFAGWAQNANLQVAAVDDILLNATNKGFMSTGGVATSYAVENIMSISMKKSMFASEKFTNDIHTSYEGAAVSSNNTEYGAFTGCFEITDGEYSGKHAMYIVNFSDEGDNTVTVTLGDAVKSTTIYQGVEAEHTGTFDITLAAGEAVLVVY